MAVRIPPRRLAERGATCELIPFTGAKAGVATRHAWDTVGEALPRGVAVVLLVAAEDVSFTAADVPALSGLRLREALPNLVEEKTVGDVGSLHVALGEPAATGRGRTLAVIDRIWLAAMQVHIVRTGHRVAAIVPDSLAVPLVPDTWSLACVGAGPAEPMRCWLRTGIQQALSLPDDPASAVAIAAAVARQPGDGPRPTQIALHAAPAVVAAATSLATALSASLDVPLATAADAGRDPFAGWLAGGGPDGGYGAPLSLLSFDGARGAGGSTWSRWRIAAALAVAIVAVQIVGMQWEWRGLRSEAAALRQRGNAILTSTFPETTVVVDAPLQMARALAGLRASSGRSDPTDFSMMMAASARIFAALPSNSLRGADYEARALRLRFAPGAAAAADERDRLVAAAAQEGYVLRFDAAPNAAGEGSASLKTRGAA